MTRHEQKYQCRHDDYTVTGTHSEVEQQLGEHLVTEHGITDSLQMAFAIERIW